MCWESDVWSHTSTVMQLNYGFNFPINSSCVPCVYSCVHMFLNMLNAQQFTHFTPKLCAMCDPNIRIGVALIAHFDTFIFKWFMHTNSYNYNETKNIIFHFEHDGKINEKRNYIFYISDSFSRRLFDCLFNWSVSCLLQLTIRMIFICA